MRYIDWDRADFDKIASWYSQDQIKRQIVEYTSKREFVLLVHRSFDESFRKRNTRMLKCDSTRNVDYILNQGLRMIKRKTPYNLYYSLATFLNGIPFRPFSRKLGSRDFRDFFKNLHEEIIAYDLLIDIDAPSREFVYDAHQVLENIHQEFIFEGIPHEVIFSGKGFHVKVPYSVLFDKDYSKNMIIHSLIKGDWKILLDQYSRIAKRLKDEYGELIDTSIYDLRRICKIPNTLSIYPDATLVCAPLNSTEEIRKFNIEDHYLDNWRRDIRSPVLHGGKDGNTTRRG